MKEAKYWQKLIDDKVKCRLCPHGCTVKPGKQGICRNKKNVDGTLYAIHYGEVSALAMDPIEKKPLYHFFPGKMILSVGTQGCNLSCDFCQNYHLWDGHVHTDKADPADIVEAARRQRSFGIAYTYNEPYISYEYVLDTARLAQAAGIKNVLVTNGFYNHEPFQELLPFVDAMNIDLKAIRNEFYKKLCHGRLDPVKKTIEQAHGVCLVEVTNLIITNENDSDYDLKGLVDFVAGISSDIPIHFSAYRPMYKMKNPSTPMERLIRAYEIAREKLNYVYLGNVILDVGSDSPCPHCGAVLVSRSGYRTGIVSLKGESCGSCGNHVNFVNN